MPLVVLPDNTGPQAISEAQAKLQAALDDPFAAVMVLRGVRPSVDAALEVCTARAAVDPLRRTLLWVTDDSVLTPQQKAAYFPRANITAAVVGLDDKVTTPLTAKQAESPSRVEEAYTDGGG